MRLGKHGENVKSHNWVKAWHRRTNSNTHTYEQQHLTHTRNSLTIHLLPRPAHSTHTHTRHTHTHTLDTHTLAHTRISLARHLLTRHAHTQLSKTKDRHIRRDKNTHRPRMRSPHSFRLKSAQRVVKSLRTCRPVHIIMHQVHLRLYIKTFSEYFFEPIYRLDRVD